MFKAVADIKYFYPGNTNTGDNYATHAGQPGKDIQNVNRSLVDSIFQRYGAFFGETQAE